MGTSASLSAASGPIGRRPSIVLGLAVACLTIPARADEPVRPTNYTETIPGSAVRFEMVGIPGGTYSMGSPAGERGRGDDEGPRHRLDIRPFWMGKTEVTWDEYNEFRKGGFVQEQGDLKGLRSQVRKAKR